MTQLTVQPSAVVNKEILDQMKGGQRGSALLLDQDHSSFNYDGENDHFANSSVITQGQLVDDYHNKNIQTKLLESHNQSKASTLANNQQRRRSSPKIVRGDMTAAVSPTNVGQRSMVFAKESD